MTEDERNSDHILEIINDNPNDPISRMELDMRTGIAKLFDKEGNLKEERLLDTNEKARWLTQDRFAEKYYSHSPYSYAIGNPIRYIDINGDSIWITHKGDNYLYENGKLSLNGQEYTGKVRGFLKQTVNALNNVAAGGNFGNTLVSDLQSSGNNYTIKYNSGRNAFEPTNTIAAMANISDYQSVTGNLTGSTGSGGTILFDPYKQSSGFNTAGTTYSPAYSSLAHEMVHASDANQGMLHYTGGDPLWIYVY